MRLLLIADFQACQPGELQSGALMAFRKGQQCPKRVQGRRLAGLGAAWADVGELRGSLEPVCLSLCCLAQMTTVGSVWEGRLTSSPESQIFNVFWITGSPSPSNEAQRV